MPHNCFTASTSSSTAGVALPVGSGAGGSASCLSCCDSFLFCFLSFDLDPRPKKGRLNFEWRTCSFSPDEPAFGEPDNDAFAGEEGRTFTDDVLDNGPGEAVCWRAGGDAARGGGRATGDAERCCC